MLNQFFTGLYSSSDAVTLADFLIIIVSALLLGALYAIVNMRNKSNTRSFILTLATIPAVVAAVILMVNGSIGAGVAVAGAFSLVRFRSAPGTAREITALFTAMAVGIACGMGCPGLAAVLTVIMALAELFYDAIGFGSHSGGEMNKLLSVTLPEDLEYAGIFDDLFEKYTREAKLVRVKTTNLGSLNKLTYDITLKGNGVEKPLVDAIRCRNGNLEVSISSRELESTAL